MKRLVVSAGRYICVFAKWWVTELATGTEDLLAYIAPQRRRALTACVSEQGVRIVEGDLNRPSIILKIQRTGSAHDSALDLPQNEVQGIERGRRIRLVFDTNFAFIRHLRMPIAALPHLKSAIELQLPKLLPLNSNLLRSDFEVVTVDPEGNFINVEIAALRVRDLEPITRALEHWGLQASSVHLAGNSQQPVRFHFGFSGSRTDRSEMRRVDLYLSAAAATLATCAMLVFGIQLYRAQNSLDKALSGTKSEAAVVLEQRQRLIARLDTLSVLSAAEHAPTAAAILSDVTARVARDAYLTTFELKGRELRIVGLSTDPAEVVKQLGSSGFVSKVSLRSSMAAGTGSGKERFEITAYVPGGM
jgi:general secretion pathway protein L